MKKLRLIGSLLLAGLLVGACTSNPKSDEAEVTEEQEVYEFEGATDLNLNLDNSQVTWVGTKPTGRHNGSFGITSGNIKVTDDQIVGGKIVIDLTDIDVYDLKEDMESHGKLVNHLKSADFFDVENNPTAIFEITKVEDFVKDATKTEEKSEFKLENPTHRISGNLTMRGNTLGISFPAKVSMKDGKIKAEAKFNIDRTKWGVSFRDEADAVAKGKDEFIYNTVNVGLDVEAAQASM